MKETVTTIYKITTIAQTTHNGCKWVKGRWKHTPGEGTLCGPGWLHCYSDPLLAVFLNPIHGNYQEPFLLWKGEAKGKRKDDHGLKSGFASMRLIDRIEVPTVTRTQRVAFGILCALEVTTDSGWRTWAEKWLSGEDRTSTVASASARAAAYTAAYAAADSAAYAAARAAAYAAARAAADAAARAAQAKTIDLVALANKALTY